MMRIRTLGVSTFLLVLGTTCAHAEYAIGHADLVCYEDANIALARFRFAPEGDPPIFRALPAPFNFDWAEDWPATGRRDCALSDGRTVRLRNDMNQPMAYGLGGAAPAHFFSLWVDRRKVISRHVWKERAHQTGVPRVIGVVISDEGLTYCESPPIESVDPIYGGSGVDSIECRTEALDLDALPVDEIEYPPVGEERPPVGTITITTGANIPVCHSFIQPPHEPGLRYPRLVQQRTAILEPDVPPSGQGLFQQTHTMPSLRVIESESQPVFTSVDRITIEGEERVAWFRTGNFDIDGDGELDLVFAYWGNTLSLDGSYLIAAPGNLDLSDAVRLLYTGPPPFGHERLRQRAIDLDWKVYSGNHPALYPHLSATFLHVGTLQIEGRIYLIAYPTSDLTDPTAILALPLPGGGAETVCVFETTKLNY